MDQPRRADPQAVHPVRSSQRDRRVRTRSPIFTARGAVAVWSRGSMKSVDRPKARTCPASTNGLDNVRQIRWTRDTSRRRLSAWQFELGCSRQRVTCSWVLSSNIKRTAEFWTRCSGATLPAGDRPAMRCNSPIFKLPVQASTELLLLDRHVYISGSDVGGDSYG